MKVYQVGGAVRDRLLQAFDPTISIDEKDWVVIGSSTEKMLALGFKQVGKHFPVFLHPESKEEYALARTEKKHGKGYHGFIFDTAKTITLEEDLSRRDLTINAIAQDPKRPHHFIDPHGGVGDIARRQLRHISHAFAEDPLRVFRVARFYARFAYLGFSVAKATLKEMQGICQAGELQHLSAERVWQETQRALQTRSPQLFFQLLYQVGGLTYWFAEVQRLFGVPQPTKWHPEIDCGVHSLMVLEQASKITPNEAIRFSSLIHDLGKATTPKHMLPSHHGHEERGVALVRSLCTRLKVPREYLQLSMLGARWHTHFHRHDEMRASTYLKVLNAIDYFRRPHHLDELLIVSESDSKGRIGFGYKPYHEKIFWQTMVAKLNQFERTKRTQNTAFQQLSNEQKKQTIHRQRLTVIQQYLKTLQVK